MMGNLDRSWVGRWTSAVSLGLVCGGCGETYDAVRGLIFDVEIEDFEADPTVVRAGEESILSWRVEDATDCEIDQGIGSVDADEGEVAVHPCQTTEYELLCMDEGLVGGEDFSSDSKRVIVTVHSVAELPCDDR